MRTSDIRGSDGYQRALAHFRQWLQPGFGQPRSFADVDVHPTQDRVVATAAVLTALEGIGTSRLFEAGDGPGRFLTEPGSDARMPRYSPDGARIALLSDREHEGVFQLHLLGPGVGEATATPEVEGVVEHLAWAPDGARILLGTAGRGADAASGAGSGTLAGDDPAQDAPAWLPEVEEAEPAAGEWRTLWVHDLAAGTTVRVGRAGLNVWDATWLGPDRLALVASDGDPREGAWYDADIRLCHLDGTAETVLLTPDSQLGAIAGSPAGARLAIVAAVASDRGVVAGSLRVIDPATGTVTALDTRGTDVADLAWLDDDRLGWSGLRGLDSVYGITDVVTGAVEQEWVTEETSGLRYPEAAWRADGALACALESYDRPPCLALVRAGAVTVLASSAGPGTDHVRAAAGRLDRVSWPARDDLEIEGLLAQPAGTGPFPLVVMIHGGPVWAFRNRWGMGNDLTPLLVARGYAVLHPNPRGSTGRGPEFARLVVGDMGGEDTHDLLRGIDALVERGIVDPERVGVTGGSYGGFMSAWLITQDTRFKAAVPLSPVIDWYSQHHTSNIPAFDAMFLDGAPRSGAGLAWSRSPLMHADKVVTPTLLTAGATDRATPPTQALEFHVALREAGVPSQCVIYPGEGHGVRALPARVDLAARVLGWFEQHMPA